MSISNSAMLVEMNISVWTGQRVDRAATDKTTSDAGATADAGQFKKNLMAGTTMRKAIADYAALCRTWHIGRTLPWADKGPRLLPTSMFFEYKKEVDARRAYFDSKVAGFVAEYPQLQAKAQIHLGDLYKADEYPTAQEVADKFAFKLVFSPVPESGDFRIDVGNDHLDQLRNQYESAYDTRVKDAMQTAWDKLHTTLTTVSEKLTEPEGDRPKLFHGTFISNVREMVELLSHLNITKDPALERARRELDRAIGTLDVDDLRGDAGARADLKAQVDSVLSGFDW
jgi:hypothetical protein